MSERESVCVREREIARERYLNAERQVAVPAGLGVVVAFVEPAPGYAGGYEYSVPPYGTAYRSTLRTTRTRHPLLLSNLLPGTKVLVSS